MFSFSYVDSTNFLLVTLPNSNHALTLYKAHLFFKTYLEASCLANTEVPDVEADKFEQLFCTVQHETGITMSCKLAHMNYEEHSVEIENISYSMDIATFMSYPFQECIKSVKVDQLQLAKGVNLPVKESLHQFYSEYLNETSPFGAELFIDKLESMKLFCKNKLNIIEHSSTFPANKSKIRQFFNHLIREIDQIKSDFILLQQKVKRIKKPEAEIKKQAELGIEQTSDESQQGIDNLMRLQHEELTLARHRVISGLMRLQQLEHQIDQFQIPNQQSELIFLKRHVIIGLDSIVRFARGLGFAFNQQALVQVDSSTASKAWDDFALTPDATPDPCHKLKISLHPTLMVLMVSGQQQGMPFTLIISGLEILNALTASNESATLVDQRKAVGVLAVASQLMSSHWSISDVLSFLNQVVEHSSSPSRSITALETQKRLM